MSQLTNYIQKELDKGFSPDLITKKLLQAGYNKEEIAESFRSLKSAEPLLVRKAIDTIHLDRKVMWSRFIFPVLALVVVFVLGYLVYEYSGGLSVLPELFEETNCDTFSTHEEKDKCLLELAAQGKGECSRISSLLYKTMCEQKIWDIDPCQYTLITGGDRETCLWQKAVETKDRKYCTKKVRGINACLLQLAQETKDPSLCGDKLLCYEEYAVATGDSNVCQLIGDKYDAERCQEYYQTQLLENK